MQRHSLQVFKKAIPAGRMGHPVLTAVLLSLLTSATLHYDSVPLTGLEAAPLRLTVVHKNRMGPSTAEIQARSVFTIFADRASARSI